MRKIIAMLIVCGFLIIYAAGAATLGGLLVDQPRWIQLIYFAVAGVIWAFPLKPVMDWMKAGPQPEDKN